MRIFKGAIFALILGATPVAAPLFAFDGAPANTDATLSGQAGAVAALKKAVPPASTADSSLTSLQYAAEGGHPVAQWKLGRMYANGDGVTQDDLRAFEYFSRIANAHAEDSPSAPQATIVANAFVALGRYYLSGIPNSKIKSDPDRAREMFSYAASYFGNADAQYDLARLYLRGVGSSRDDRHPTKTVRWRCRCSSTGCRGVRRVGQGESVPTHNVPNHQTTYCAVSRSRSIHTGTWSDGFSQART